MTEYLSHTTLTHLADAEDLIEKLYQALVEECLGISEPGGVVDVLDSYEEYKKNWLENND